MKYCRKLVVKVNIKKVIDFGVKCGEIKGEGLLLSVKKEKNDLICQDF